MFNIPKKQKTKQVGIFIPTFGRPHELSRVVDNLYENTPPDLFELYFIVENGDQATIDAIKPLRAKLIVNEGKPCYADAINTAYHKTREPYFFTGADDLGFYVNWLEEALSHMSDKIKVVGTNDLGQIPIGEQRNSTHYLVARDYIKKYSGVIDMKDTVLYPYVHNYTDVELTETAMSRGVYNYCPESKVEHNHFAWGKAQVDETYKRGLRSEGQDRNTFMQRRHLWQDQR